jgi:hypothetical protein
MTRYRTLATVLAAVGLTSTLAIGAGPADASGGGGDTRVIRTGSCSDGARWKMKAKEDDGRIEVEAEIDSNQSGQTWRWTLRHNGSVADRGTSRTAGRSGSFDVERTAVDNPGTDRFTFRATHAGEVCVAKVTW